MIRARVAFDSRRVNGENRSRANRTIGSNGGNAGFEFEKQRASPRWGDALRVSGTIAPSSICPTVEKVA